MPISRLILTATTALLLIAAACTSKERPAPTADGGMSSGIAPTRLLVSLTPAELNALCVYVSAASGGPEEVDCGDGFSIGGPTVEECELDLGSVDPTCAALVGEVETCFEAIGVDICALVDNPPEVCVALRATCPM